MGCGTISARCLSPVTVASSSQPESSNGQRRYDPLGTEQRWQSHWKDIDLDSGVRILDTHWVLTPANRSTDTWYDRMVFDVNGAYGDPYERYAAQIYKTGRYRVDARTRKADYKWAKATAEALAG